LREREKLLSWYPQCPKYRPTEDGLQIEYCKTEHFVHIQKQNVVNYVLTQRDH